MAYSNWGAFVYCGDKRRRDCEDVPVFGDRSDEAGAPPGARIWINLLKARASGIDAWWRHAHHAVLGDGPVRLCGYKSSPELYVLRTGATGPERIEIAFYDADYNRKGVSGENDGFRWSAEPSDEPEGVFLTLVEPDGKVWSARCGYCIGAGHEDDPDPPDADQPEG